MRNLTGLKNNFTDCDLSYSDFTGLVLSNVGLTSLSFNKSATSPPGPGCNLTGAKLNNCTFSSTSSFSGSTMIGTEMKNSNFDGVQFVNVTFGVSPKFADFSDTSFKNE